MWVMGGWRRGWQWIGKLGRDKSQDTVMAEIVVSDHQLVMLS